MQTQTANMKTKYYLVLLMSVLFSLCSGAPTKDDYDHLMLVLDWPNGYCSGRTCTLSPLPQQFVLHGLWPVTTDGKDITNCADPSTDITSLFKDDAQLQNGMLEDWPSLTNAKTDLDGQRKFWNDQWIKHGSCQTVLAAKPYFEQALNLTNQVDLLNTLKNKNISVGGSYTREKYVTAIQSNSKIGNITVFFRCKAKGTYDLLQEVVVCVDKSAQNFIGCDKERGRDNCKTDDIKLASQIELFKEAFAFADTHAETYYEELQLFI